MWHLREGSQFRRSPFGRLDEHTAEPEQMFPLLLQDCALIQDTLYQGRMMSLERHSLLVTTAFSFVVGPLWTKESRKKDRIKEKRKETDTFLKSCRTPNELPFDIIKIKNTTTTARQPPEGCFKNEIKGLLLFHLTTSVFTLSPASWVWGTTAAKACSSFSFTAMQPSWLWRLCVVESLGSVISKTQLLISGFTNFLNLYTVGLYSSKDYISIFGSLFDIYNYYMFVYLYIRSLPSIFVLLKLKLV